MPLDLEEIEIRSLKLKTLSVPTKDISQCYASLHCVGARAHKNVPHLQHRLNVIYIGIKAVYSKVFTTIENAK